MRISISRTFAAACLTLAALACQRMPSEAATTWECYVYNPLAKQPSVEAVVRMADEVKEKTHGNLLINIHLGGSLPIKADGITAGVADNVIQFGDDGFATGTIPVTGVLHLPMLIQNVAEMKKALEIVRPYLDAAYGKRGIEVLGRSLLPRASHLGPEEDRKPRRSQGNQDARNQRRTGRVHPPLRRRGADDGIARRCRGAGSRRGRRCPDGEFRRRNRLA